MTRPRRSRAASSTSARTDTSAEACCSIDEQGWEDLHDLLAETLDTAMQIQADSASRASKDGDETFGVNLVMMTPPDAELREGDHGAELGHAEEAPQHTGKKAAAKA